MAKQKPQDHQVERFATSPAEILFGEFPHRTSAGIFIPALGTAGSPLPGCQTHFGVVPDVRRTIIEIAPARNWTRVVVAHRDGKRFVVRADEKLIAFLELESAMRPL